jgi:predicted dehydrogenase
MGRRHATAARRAGATVAVAVDPLLERAGLLDAGSTHPDLGAALRADTIDVVHVCTPLDAHAGLARAALAAGAHVIVEKPLAPDSATTDELLRLADDTGRILVPVHQFLLQDGFRRVLAHLGELGTLVDLDFVAATAGAELTGMDAGGVVDDVLPHPLSLFERLAPGSTAGSWDVRRPSPGELRASTGADDTTLSITVTTRGRPTRNELVVTGAAGTAHLDLFHGFAALEGGGRSRARKVSRPFARGAGTLAHASANLVVRAVRRETAYPGLQELVRSTYASILAGEPPPILPAEARAVAVARDAILASTGG